MSGRGGPEGMSNTHDARVEECERRTSDDDGDDDDDDDGGEHC